MTKSEQTLELRLNAFLAALVGLVGGWLSDCLLGWAASSLVPRNSAPDGLSIPQVILLILLTILPVAGCLFAGTMQCEEHKFRIGIELSLVLNIFIVVVAGFVSGIIGVRQPNLEFQALATIGVAVLVTEIIVCGVLRSQTSSISP